MATYYGLEHYYYEGGIDITGSESFNTAKLPANYDPRMQTLVTDYLKDTFTNGADMPVFYTLAGTHGPSGTWGLTENLANTTGYKCRGAVDAANGATPAPTAGRILGGSSLTLAGNSYILDKWGNTGPANGDITWASNGDTFDYLLNAASDSAYNLTLTVGANGPATLELLLDDTLVKSISIASTAGTTNFTTLPAIPLQLAAGLHTLRLRAASGASGIRSLGFSPTSVAPPPTPTAPATPTNVTATAASSSSIALKWTDVAGETSYQLERSSDGVTFAPVATLPADTTSYTHTGLPASTKVTYRLRAANVAGASPWSSLVSATTLAAPAPTLATPTNFGAVAIVGPAVQLSWNDITGETGYRVQRSTDGSNWAVIATVAANTTSWTDASVTRNTTYYYRLVAFSSTAAASPTPVVMIRSKNK